MRGALVVCVTFGAMACSSERRRADEDEGERARWRARASSEADAESLFGPRLGKDGELREVDPIDALLGDGKSATSRRYGMRAPASGAPSAVASSWGAGLGLSGIGAGNGEPPFGGSRDGPNGPGVADRGLTVRGAIAPEVVQGVIRSAWPGLRLCYETVLEHRPIGGDLDVAFDVAPDGSVVSARSEGTLTDATAKLCVHRIFEGLRFPPIGAAGASVHSFLSFYPGTR